MTDRAIKELSERGIRDLIDAHGERAQMHVGTVAKSTWPTWWIVGEPAVPVMINRGPVALSLPEPITILRVFVAAATWDIPVSLHTTSCALDTSAAWPPSDVLPATSMARPLVAVAMEEVKMRSPPLP
jgi:hypothetical protein